MGQEKQTAAKGQESLRKATDTLSTMLAQEVKELNARQKAQRGDGSDPALMKGLKEATAVLKDLAAVAKTLNDQGADAEACRRKERGAVWCCCRGWRRKNHEHRGTPDPGGVAAPAPAGGVHAPPRTRSPVRGRGRRRQE